MMAHDYDNGWMGGSKHKALHYRTTFGVNAIIFKVDMTLSEQNRVTAHSASRKK